MSEPNYPEIAKHVLKISGNRATPARVQVLGLLLSSEAALSHQDIEQSLQHQQQHFDRVTVYRTLDWLVSHNVAHRIVSGERSSRYNAQVNASSRHAHFHCKQCAQVMCLEQLQPALLCQLPEGYELEQAELNLQGYCPLCAQGWAQDRDADAGKS